MKIISGRLKGRSIKINKGSGFRPTLSRIREDLFNLLKHSKILNINIEDIVFFDLFCGKIHVGTIMFAVKWVLDVFAKFC